MLRWRRALRAGRMRTADAGTSLVEVVVAMSVLAVLITVFMSLVLFMSRSTVAAGRVTKAGTQLRAALDSIGRDAASSSAVNTPTRVDNDLYLELLRDAVQPGTSPMCTQWRFRSASQDLQLRTWDTVTATASPWRTVVTDVVNNVDTRPPFSVQGLDDVHDKPMVTLDVVVAPVDAPTVTVTSAYTLRNYTGTADEVCTEVGRS